MSELEETKKMKVVQLHNETSKQFLIPTSTPKIAHYKTVIEAYSNPKISPSAPQKVQNDPKIESKSNVRIEGNIENKSCSTT